MLLLLPARIGNGLPALDSIVNRVLVYFQSFPHRFYSLSFLNYFLDILSLLVSSQSICQHQSQSLQVQSILSPTFFFFFLLTLVPSIQTVQFVPLSTLFLPL